MGKDQKPNPSLSRRDFITGMAVKVAAAGAGVAALSPLINAEEVPSVDDFLQQHYERLTTDQKKRSLRDWKARSIRHMASRRVFPIRNRSTGWCMAMPLISVAALGVENASMPV